MINYIIYNIYIYMNILKDISLFNLFTIFFGIYLYFFINNINVNYNNISINLLNEVKKSNIKIVLLLVTIYTIIVYYRTNSLVLTMDPNHLTRKELNLKHLKGSLIFALLGLLIGFLGRIGIWGLNFFLIFIIYYIINPNRLLKSIYM